MDTDGKEVLLHLRRLKEKMARYESHEQFIKKCLKFGEIPNGFTLNWSAELDMDLNLMDKCSNIKQDASMKLMELSVEACNKKVMSLSNEIKKAEAEASKSDILQTNMWRERERTRLQEVKDRKWQKIESKSSKAFTEFPVDGDGNCFYRCLAVFRFGTQDAHDKIRKDICEYMNRNSQHFECYVDPPIYLML